MDMVQYMYGHGKSVCQALYCKVRLCWHCPLIYKLDKVWGSMVIFTCTTCTCNADILGEWETFHSFRVQWTWQQHHCCCKWASLCCAISEACHSLAHGCCCCRHSMSVSFGETCSHLCTVCLGLDLVRFVHDCPVMHPFPCQTLSVQLNTNVHFVQQQCYMCVGFLATNGHYGKQRFSFL